MNHTFVVEGEEIQLDNDLFQTVAALVYLNRTTKHHGILPIKLVRNQLDCGLKNAKRIVDHISEHLVVSIKSPVELSVPVPAVVYLAPGTASRVHSGWIARPLGEFLRERLKDDNPDRYCYTEADGSCSSTDPRCMHNRHVDEYSHGSTCDRTKVGKSDGENND